MFIYEFFFNNNADYFIPYIENDDETNQVTDNLDNHLIAPSSEDSEPETKPNKSSEENVTNNTTTTVRKSKRKTRLPAHLEDYVMYAANVIDDEEPKTIEEAIASKYSAEWKKAMDQEITSLNKSSTWYVTTLPEGQHTIDLKWLYKIKRDSEGKVDRFKARLVAKGYMQRPGIDYNDTYSPVVKNSSIRFLLATALSHGLLLYHLDVETAFLNSDLDEEIYANIPPYVSKPKPNSVLKLNKALYGLKQSSSKWNQKLVEVLKSMGFTQ